MQHSSNDADLLLFTIPTRRLLDFLEQATGQPIAEAPNSVMEAQRWHLALREGLRHPLHLDVGIPGIYKPENPVVENESAIHSALLLGMSSVKVILSGEWEEACRIGLITREQLEKNESALHNGMLAEDFANSV